MATDSSNAAPPAFPLRTWLEVLCPVYRGTLAGLVVLNLLSAVGTFIELQLLWALTVALSGPAAMATEKCSFGEWIGSGFSLAPHPCGASLPMFLLATYLLSTLTQSGFDLLAYTVNSRLLQRARHDVERELLRNLLRQSDAFFIRRSPAEIVSRLSGDLQRISDRRQNLTQGSATALSIVATLLVLVTQSWLAAVAGLAVSLIGVLSALPRMRKLGDLDRESTLADERVKSAFEDTLQGVAEIQVSGVLSRMLNRFNALQTSRDAIALRFAGLLNRNMVSQKLTFTLGFIAIIAIFIFGNLFGSASGPGSGGQTAGLIVLLISTLPELYFRFADMTQRATQFRMAGQSVKRLLQYEAPDEATEAAPGAVASPAPVPSPYDGVRLRNVRYQFAGGEAVQGGPNGLDCLIPSRGLTGIVGPAGSGKSTLIKLILGRQPRLSGAIELPDSGGRPPFAYLPQRPLTFDAPIRDNLFLGDAPSGARARVSANESLAELGLIDLIRLKGLDARPHGAVSFSGDVAALRSEFRAAAQAALGAEMRPLTRNVCGPSQMAIESQLDCAIDREPFCRYLASDAARKIVTSLAKLDYGRGMAPLAHATLRATAPLLAKVANVDEYNGVSTFKLDPSIFTLRRMAIETLSGDDAPPMGPPSPLLVAIAISLKLEELAQPGFPEATDPAVEGLRALAEGFSAPLDETQVNSLLPWRDNLLFATPAGPNSRDLLKIDHALIDRLKTTPLDAEVIESGFDYPVGRLGGRLSGGQQQLIGLGRVLLTDAMFLILDEPSSAFHPQLRQAAVRVLKRESEKRGGVVVTHDVDLARACDRLVFIRDGVIVGQGAWRDLEAKAEGFSAWLAASKENA
ncbi:MAG: ABC transporter transmembrane domain-containing protein [Roseiarcus sp.]|jgi:ABC-type multidrug transport system fused ATPase/permease subunit